MNRKLIAAIAIYIGLIAVCCTALYVVPSVQGMLEKTYIAEYGSIDVTDEVSAFIVRDETVYTAKQASTIKRLVENGKLVKASTHVVEAVPDSEALEEEEAARIKESERIARESAKGNTEEAEEAANRGEQLDKGKYNDIMTALGDSVRTTEDGKCEGPGYICYYVDGAEAKFNTGAIDSLRYSDYKALADTKAIETPSDKCGSGYPLFKVVKNARWYLVYYISKEDAAKYDASETVTIETGAAPMEATVSQVITGRKYARVTLSCKSFFDGFFEMRTLDTTVNVAHAEGLILEDSSIVEASDGRIGVFVKDKLGNHVFKPVAKKADDGSKCAVYSDIYVDDGGNYVETIIAYDEVIAAPDEEDMAALEELVKEEQAEAAAYAAESAVRGTAEDALAKAVKAAEEAAKAEQAAKEAAEKAAQEAEAAAAAEAAPEAEQAAEAAPAEDTAAEENQAAETPAEGEAPAE